MPEKHDELLHVTLPTHGNGEMSEAALEKVAGGVVTAILPNGRRTRGCNKKGDDSTVDNPVD